MRRTGASPPTPPDARFLGIQGDVHDPGEAARWFAGILKVHPHIDDDGVRVALGGFHVALCASSTETVGTLGLNGRDCDADYAEVVQRGAEPISPPAGRPWGVRAAYVKGPGALVVEFEQPQPKLARARRLIDAKFSEPLQLVALADAAGISRFHFHRAFRRAFHDTPGRYVAAQRLQAAKRLLQATEDSVTDVCLAVGFHSLGSFSAFFKRHCGMTPREFRRRARAFTSAEQPDSMAASDRWAVSHVHVGVRELLPAAEWFAECLGLPLSFENDRMIVLKSGERSLVLDRRDRDTRATLIFETDADRPRSEGARRRRRRSVKVRSEHAPANAAEYEGPGQLRIRLLNRHPL